MEATLNIEMKGKLECPTCGKALRPENASLSYIVSK